MMSQEFENYYLQTKGASSWETIEEAQKLDSLVVKLEDKKADFSGFKVRIIGASFDEENSIWNNLGIITNFNEDNLDLAVAAARNLHELLEKFETTSQNYWKCRGGDKKGSR